MEVQALIGNTGYAKNATQELMEHTALALNTLANATAEER